MHLDDSIIPQGWYNMQDDYLLFFFFYNIIKSFTFPLLTSDSRVAAELLTRKKKSAANQNEKIKLSPQKLICPLRCNRIVQVRRKATWRIFPIVTKFRVIKTPSLQLKKTFFSTVWMWFRCIWLLCTYVTVVVHIRNGWSSFKRFVKVHLKIVVVRGRELSVFSATILFVCFCWSLQTSGVHLSFSLFVMLCPGVLTINDNNTSNFQCYKNNQISNTYLFMPWVAMLRQLLSFICMLEFFFVSALAPQPMCVYRPTPEVSAQYYTWSILLIVKVWDLFYFVKH